MRAAGISRRCAAALSLLASLALVGCAATRHELSGGPQPSAVRAELERVEDIRILHRYAIQHLHDARALALYLKGWGGPDRAWEVEDMFIEADGLYGATRGVDHGATAMQAQLDVKDAPAIPADQLDLVQRERADIAARVMEFHARCQALKAELAEQVKAAAAKKVKWDLTSQPEPWPDAEREAGRQGGLAFGWRVHETFFDLTGESQDYLLGKAARMGFTFANVQWAKACNWGDIEREPGKYDFAALDGMMARFAAHGIKVRPMLRTLTGTPPQWHIQKHGGESCFVVMARNPQTGKDEEVPQGINLFHGPTGEGLARFLSAYAAHLKDKWPQAVEAVYVEGNQSEIEPPPDRSNAIDPFWRAWSRTDSAWRTPEAILADAKPDEALAVRAEMCREAWLLEYVRGATAPLKAGWPELRVQTRTASDDFHRLFAGTTGRSRDLPALCRLCQNPSTGSDSPAGLAAVRSFAGGRWLWHLDIHSGCGITPGASCAQTAFYDVVRIVAGAYGNSIRAHFPGGWFRYCDWQIGDFGIGSYYLTPRRSQELSPVILNTSIPRAQVAVLWSQSSLRRDRSHDWFRSVMAMGHLLARSSVRFDFVAEEGLADSLKGYKALILCETQTMPTSACDAIREWVRGGGIVMGFGAPGLYDEYGARRGGLPLADVFGADIAKLRTSTAVRPDDLFTGHPEGAYVTIAPRPYKFQADKTTVLKPAGGKVRAWFASDADEPAIVENAFGQGSAMLCGFPLGFEYWETAPYEIGYGLTHSRQTNYNEEQRRYEHWIAVELEKRGVVRDVTVPYGRMLRAQRGDDPDWFHVARNAPRYQEYMFEEDRPARTVYSFLRTREGIGNLYVGLSHTEGNYFWERGYFISTLAGGEVQASVALNAPTGQGAPVPVVFDARLEAPVPCALRGGRLEFSTWLPAAQSSAFAIAPDGKVRLFGRAQPSGDGPDAVAARVAQCEGGAPVRDVEILDAPQIAAFLDARRGKSLLIGCGDTRLKAVGDEMAHWLKEAYGIDARVTMAGPRASCRFAYMDGFGYTQFGGEPVKADILIGNCQDNFLMQRFLTPQGWCSWLPLEVNEDFPGPGRALVMLSVPVITQSNGQPGGKVAEQQLVIGASSAAEAIDATRALRRALK